MKQIKNIIVFACVLPILLACVCLMHKSNQRVEAESSSVSKYEYDNLGRIKRTIYKSGDVFEYNYDNNGNIISVTMIKKTDKKEDQDSTSHEDQEDTSEQTSEDKTSDSDENKIDKSTEKDISTTENISGEADKEESNGREADKEESNSREADKEESNGGKANKDESSSGKADKDESSSEELRKEEDSGREDIEASIVSLDKEAVLEQYNAFKKRRPVIKSLKLIKKEGKNYLNIQIKTVIKKGEYHEIGYKVKNSYNNKFKKSKTITIKRNLKKKITAKKWKVANKKGYYVKVRAYIVTKSGKEIYSKYSKTKKIELAK